MQRAPGIPRFEAPDVQEGGHDMRGAGANTVAVLCCAAFLVRLSFTSMGKEQAADRQKPAITVQDVLGHVHGGVGSRRHRLSRKVRRRKTW